MKIRRLLFICLILSLAGTLLWADLSWGQRRNGTGPFCPANPNAAGVSQTQGQGVGGGCPYYTGTRGQGQGQGRGWGRGRGQGPGRGQGRGQQGGFGQNAGQNVPTSPAGPAQTAK